MLFKKGITKKNLQKAREKGKEFCPGNNIKLLEEQKQDYIEQIKLYLAHETDETIRTELYTELEWLNREKST